MKTLLHLTLLSLTLLLMTACVSEHTGSFQNFEKIQAPADRDLPSADLPAVRQGLANIANKREQDTLQTLEYWEKIREKYNAALTATTDPAALQENIEKFVQAYAEYRKQNRRSLLMELQDAPWPYGLKDWKEKFAANSTNTPLSNMSAQAQAIQSCPVWLERMENPRTAETVDTQELLQAWQSAYLSQLPAIHAFWLSVNLCMEAQSAHLARVPLNQNEEYSESDLVNRHTFDLPLQLNQSDRVAKLDAFLKNHPAYQHDRKRFKPVYNINAPWKFREQLLGMRNLWTAVLYSQFKGNEWISEGSYQAGENKVAETTIYNQRGWGGALFLPIWLPLPLVADGDTWSYRVKPGGNEDPKQEGSLFALFPFYVSAIGTMFLEQQEKAKVDIQGVPILYARGRIESERGRETTAQCVLLGNIYIGGTLHLNEKTPKAYYHSVGPLSLLYTSVYTDDNKDGFLQMSGLGFLWASRQAKDDLAEYNGPLWGFLGWGNNSAGRPVWRIFGIPIPRNGETKRW